MGTNETKHNLNQKVFEKSLNSYKIQLRVLQINVEDKIAGRLIVFLIILLSSTVAFGDVPNPICKNNPDGIVKDYYPHGVVQTEWGCKNGHLNGVTKLYYESGALKKEANYKNDKMDGPSHTYYESGVLEGACNYKDGDLDGVRKIYFENGTLKEVLNFGK